MDGTIPDKRYFRIGEVGRILGVETYVIRFWESEFKSLVRPDRSEADQRLYRKKDVEQLQLIKHLLYDEKLTIAGAKKRLSGGAAGERNAPPADGHVRMLAEIKKRLQELKKILR
jgi:DNA-binding transcriptional MerR regulator